MTDLDAVVAQALESLRRPRALADAEAVVPGRPGLYAIHGDATTWRELGLGAPDERPLYLGKAERSLIARDLRTHFGDGGTGHSTVRRSFAALLHDARGLRGIPRNPARPGYFSSYGLSAAQDAELTRWMRERLELATWATPSDCAVPLRAIEAALLAELAPPLNLQGVATPWTAGLRAARAVMAEEARASAASR